MLDVSLMPYEEISCKRPTATNPFLPVWNVACCQRLGDLAISISNTVARHFRPRLSGEPASLSSLRTPHETGAPTAAPDALIEGREAQMVTADARGAPDAPSIPSFQSIDDRLLSVHHTPAAADVIHRPDTGPVCPAGVRRRDF